ncbi:MAG: hypothetical protein ABFD96_15605 [Armatimonadia bacterium]
MSELAHRRYMKAPTIGDATPEDTLEAALWELRNQSDPTEHVIVIRSFINEGGMHYNVTQGGKFDIAQRLGLITQVAHRMLEQ